IIELVARRYGPIRAIESTGWAPAERFALEDGTRFGVIASTTAPFCRTCDRGRLTADGTFLLCLYGQQGLNLRALPRPGAEDRAIAAEIASVWTARTERGAEQRSGLAERGILH